MIKINKGKLLLIILLFLFTLLVYAICYNQFASADSVKQAENHSVSALSIGEKANITTVNDVTKEQKLKEEKQKKDEKVENKQSENKKSKKQGSDDKSSSTTNTEKTTNVDKKSNEVKNRTVQRKEKEKKEQEVTQKEVKKEEPKPEKKEEKKVVKKEQTKKEKPQKSVPTGRIITLQSEEQFFNLTQNDKVIALFHSDDCPYSPAVLSRKHELVKMFAPFDILLVNIDNFPGIEKVMGNVTPTLHGFNYGVYEFSARGDQVIDDPNFRKWFEQKFQQ